MPAPHHSVFLQAGCPSCRPTNSVKALKAIANTRTAKKITKAVASMDQNPAIEQTHFSQPAVGCERC